MSWQFNLLEQISLTAPVHYIISDPDNLCFEPLIARALEDYGTEIITVEDPIALRLHYEEWFESESRSVLIIRVIDSNSSIAYDIESSAIKLDFDITQVIPQIDSAVLRGLTAKDYGQVLEAVKNYRVGKLNYFDSLDFILRHIFKIAPEVIQSETDLVRLLIRKHYLGIEMPKIFEDRLIETLGVRNQFKNWEFDRLLPYRASFFTFLQKQWELYLDQKVKTRNGCNNIHSNYELVVPFNDQDIKVFIDNLFADGILKAVKFDGLEENEWEWIGVVTDDTSRDELRLNLLISKLSKVFMNTNDNFTIDFWEETARDLAIVNVLSSSLNAPDSMSTYKEVESLNRNIDLQFENWLQESFGKVINQPTIRYPKILHKVPDWLDLRVRKDKKVCLLVMDGMGFQQWLYLKESILTIPDVKVEERGIFAFIPTITSISRQSLFSGKLPRSFPNSLLTTSREKALWQAYWSNRGLGKNEIAYAVKVENSWDLESFKELFHSPRLRVAGFVINYIDEQMHGIKSGMSGLNAALVDWISKWQFANKIKALLDSDFEIVITADHGNQQAIGQGWANEGVKAETKGERVRLYKHEVSDCNPNVVKWPAKKYGLPPDIYPLVSRSNHAFIQKDKLIVGHGGISLHEVVVPLAIISRD